MSVRQIYRKEHRKIEEKLKKGKKKEKSCEKKKRNRKKVLRLLRGILLKKNLIFVKFQKNHGPKMKIPTVTNCCCCLSLRTAGLTLGAFGVLANMIGVLSGHAMAVNGEFDLFLFILSHSPESLCGNQRRRHDVVRKQCTSTHVLL